MRLRPWWIILMLCGSTVTGCRPRAKIVSVSPPQSASGNPPDIVRYWRYELAGVKNNTVLAMDGVSVIFEGVRFSGKHIGGLPIAGPSRMGSKNSRDGGFQYLYMGRVNSISFGGRGFQLEEMGTVLVAGKKRFPLEGEKKIIVLRKNGTAELYDPYVAPDIPAGQAYAVLLKAWKEGKQAEVEQYLKGFVRKYPNDQRLAFFQAACTRSRFDTNAAPALLKRAERLNPKTPQGRCARLLRNMDGIRALNYQRDPEANFIALRSLVKANPEDPLLLWMLAVQCRASRRNAEGVEHYRHLLQKVGTGSSMIHQTYANLLDEMGHHKEALPHRYLAVKLEPAPWSYTGLAQTLEALGQQEKAGIAYNKAQNPNYEPPVLPPDLANSEAKRRRLYEEHYKIGLEIVKRYQGQSYIPNNQPEELDFLERHHLTDAQYTLIDVEGTNKRWYFTPEQRRLAGLPP